LGPHTVGITTLVQPRRVGEPAWTKRGSQAYHRVSLALFLAGFATFSLLYCVQPLLPAFAGDFRVSPTKSSLALSLSTGFLAAAIPGAGAVSEVVGRRGLMFASLIGAAFLNMAAAVAPNWQALLTVRALEGFVLGGVPAVAMAYLAEEIHPRGLGLSMGLYVGGNAFGGMFGRVIIGALTQFTSWRVALGAMGLLDLVAAIGFFVLLPVSRNFVRQPRFKLRYHLVAWHGHLRPGQLPLLFLIGFLLQGAFTTVYNYAAFRLTGTPYKLSDTEISLIFLVYLFGIVSSGVAGALSDRHGRGHVLIAGIAIAGIGVGLTLLQPVTAIICGVALLTVGFFIGHSTASSWVAKAALGAKGHASSLYLLAYYLGSSIMGSIGGWFWSAGQWPAVAAFVIILLALAFAADLLLLRWRSL
jgi:YNFM family putative membrane transporter